MQLTAPGLVLLRTIPAAVCERRELPAAGQARAAASARRHLAAARPPGPPAPGACRERRPCRAPRAAGRAGREVPSALSSLLTRTSDAAAPSVSRYQKPGAIACNEHFSQTTRTHTSMLALCCSQTAHMLFLPSCRTLTPDSRFAEVFFLFYIEPFSRKYQSGLIESALTWIHMTCFLFLALALSDLMKEVWKNPELSINHLPSALPSFYSGRKGSNKTRSWN
ncbi:uncharacterized protein LOC120324495 [Pipra filicauda]|uniref:Uncharacterized protein LOC120324495 n=1 Tax=Pipra filicauda TaxID=649802 RepID=A0A7R5KRZ9_9PASS|nr:uncharacterized protein LOC120324495 [Pipra filicauda]